MSKHIKVYDRKNPERLLGTIPASELPPPSGRVIQFVSMPRIMPVAGPCDPLFWDETRYDRHILDLEHQRTDGGWTINICLQTDAPLSALSTHPGWRFPERD